MGWGCQAAKKRDIIFPANEHYLVGDEYANIPLLHQIKAIVIDVNAVLRQMLAPGSTISPRTAIHILFKHHVACCSSAEMVVFAFDSPDKIPVERTTFHNTVRYPLATRAPVHGEVLANDGRIYKYETRPIDDSDVQHITMDHIPGGGSWDRIWNSKKGKKRMWDVLYLALEDFLLRHVNKRCIYIIDTQSDGRVYIPPVWESHDKNIGPNFGEADAKVLQYGLCLKETFSPVLIDSIDWDMPLQALIPDTSGIYIRIGTIFSTPDGEHVFYSKRSATKVFAANKNSMQEPQKCIEIINGTTLMNKFPTRAHRLEALFWCLSAGGVDYCKGLSSFGVNEAKCVTLIQSLTKDGCRADYIPFIKEGYINEESPMVRCVELDLHKLVKRLISVKPSRVRNNCISNFNEELQHIMFCVLYLGIGFDPMRTRGGPILSTESMFAQNVHSVLECYSGKFSFNKVYYSETFPETVPRMNPDINYSAPIAKMIKLR